ncbi:trans-sulfuration enzyme family protein [Chloroflexota bacterium]
MGAKKHFAEKPHFGTVALHGGDNNNPTHAHVLPIFQSSTYKFDDVAHGQAIWRDEQDGYIYGRLKNPNTDATANIIAALEGINLSERPYGLLAGSGMGAISTVLVALTAAGDTIISQQALYGATHTILTKHMPRRDVKHDTFDGTNLAGLEAALERNENVRAVYIETPANPTMALTDIRGVVTRAHAAGAVVIVDNTFASPYIQRPLEMGADVVVHSTTKYLTGHGTVIGGAIVTPDKGLYQEFKHILVNYGAVAGPMDAWLTQQGLKTFQVRMERHCSNGLAVARFLDEHPAIARVYYPGLETFPQHDLACAQMDEFGAMMSFELKGGYAAGVSVMNNVQVCTLAVSLGIVDTVIAHPASMMASTVAPEDRAKMGISEGLVRFSVGIEDVEDLISDLDQALRA